MNSAYYKLDNPVWHSLNEQHSDYAVDYEGFKFYHPDYCPFGGFVNLNRSTKNIDAYSTLIEQFYIVGKKPLFSNKLTLQNNLVCNQMVLTKPQLLETTTNITALVSTAHKADLSKLINLVQPGYFKSKTAELGRYFGIYKDGELIATTGQRMNMDGFREISAVVTHPEHTRKGYAKQLVMHVAKQIFANNSIPYLHVAETNIGAIKLYEKLGFSTRRKISFWKLQLSNKQ